MVTIGHVFDKNDARFAELRKWTLELVPDAEFQKIGDVEEPEPAPNANSPPETPAAKIDVIFWSDQAEPISKIRERPDLSSVPIIAFLSNPRLADPNRKELQSVNEIILLPTERLLFLQKLEIYLAKDEAVTQGFLFELKLEAEYPNLRFDLGKSVQITHLSETSCTLISRSPLVRGLEGTLACNVFWSETGSTSWKDRLVEIRVQDSVPYLDSNLAASDTSELRYEVRLRFFGLRQTQLRNLRIWLTKNVKAKWPEINRSNDKPLQILRIALISPRLSAESALRSNLQDLAYPEITRHQGLQSFLQSLDSLLPNSAQEDGTQQLAASALLFSPEFIGPKRPEEIAPALHADEVRLTIRSDDLFIEKIDPAPPPSAAILGFPLSTWEKDASPIFQSLNPVDRSVLEEAFHWVAKGQLADRLDRQTELELILFPKPWLREKFFFRIKLLTPRQGTNSPVLELEIRMSAASSSPAKSSAQSDPVIKTNQLGFEAILIDASLFQSIEGQNEILRERMTSIAAKMEKAALKNAFGNSPPIIMFHADNNFDETSLRGTPVRQLVFNFEDRRYIAELFISLSRPELWTSPGLSVAEFTAALDAAIFRPTKLLAISEAGFRIRDRIPFKPATHLRVFSSLWPNREQPIWARVRRVQAIEEGFATDFVILAVDDEIQKAVRNFGLQDHVNRKKAQMS
jgi:hypothetical protein